MTQPSTNKASLVFLLLRVAIFTVVVPASVTVWIPLYWLFPWLRGLVTPNRGMEVIAAVLIAAGAAGYVWCALDFAFRGKGTPAPIEPPKVLVVQGLYRFVRNPMYISVLTVLVGECVLLRSPILVEYAVLVALAFHLFVLFYEEPALRRKMGPAYEQYCREVPRWIPRFAPRRAKDAL
ncbi:MAG: isoprenylcysteine carboxylmethyltransferase family protein [Candidatus Acidiferrales bacterium]